MSLLRASRAAFRLSPLAACALVVCLLSPVALTAQATSGTRLPTPGQMFDEGLAAYDRKDFAQSAALFQRACEKGVSNACMNLAVQYMQGAGVTADPARGLAMFERGCSLGNTDACANAATARQRMAARAAAAPATPTTSIARAAQACLSGSQPDCVRAGLAYTFGREGVTKDHALAHPLLLKACDGGHMVSCAYAGVDFETGNGTAVDLPKSGEYYARACNGGDLLSGCGNLGRFYDLGESYAMAEPAYGKACAIPNPNYCFYQGQALFRLGRAAEALPLFERACAGDISGGCAFAGYVQAQRENWDAANVHYAKACRLGDTAHCAYSRQLASDIERRREWHAQRAAERAEASRLIASGNIAAAADYAVYQLRSGPLANEVVQTAMRRNAMGALNTQTLYVLASWFRDGPVSAAVNNQLRARGTGLEGTFGVGTNTPGAAEARWRAANGGGASAYGGYRPATSSVPTPAPMGNTSSAAEQVRRQYRTAHCEMAGSNRNAAVCRP